MRRLLISLVIGASALATTAACTGRGHATYAVSASYQHPSMAYVAPGVYVVEDYNEPVFFHNDFYWRYHNNNWYRSRNFGAGWVYARPPRALMSIDRPHAYVRYRPSARTTGRYRVDRGRNVQRAPGGVEVRDHRAVPRYR
jgi:hypothetical protein